MTAEIISVGTEILLGQIVDTNAAILGELFANLGIRHVHRQTVGDNQLRLTEALKLALSRADIVITIGGLGPTMDDMTRDGISAALGEEMVLDEGVQTTLKELFASRGLTWTETQNRQAMRPVCATPIPNPFGTAPGLICKKNGKTVIAMPGPKQEFEPMAKTAVREALMGAGGGEQIIHSVVVRVAGMGESIVEEKLKDLMMAEQPTVAPYAKQAEVHLRVTASGSDIAASEKLIAPTVAVIQERLGHHVYGFGDTTLEEAVVNQLLESGKTLTVAESCTGGLFGGRITSVPGSSSVFLGGFLTYSNSSKQELLGVGALTLKAVGAVSPECASEMALGARRQLDADFAVSITGIAGPGGGSEEKPVGLVYIGIADREGCEVKEFKLRGSRETVRLRATQVALVFLRSRLMGS